MEEKSPTAVLKSVRSFSRDGGIASVVCDTVDGQQLTLKIDVRYLWSVAADLRLASIDLLAPVPEALRAALGSQADQGEEADGDKKESPAGDEDDNGSPKSGYSGLEQAWGLCDDLNEAHIEHPDLGAEAVLAKIGSGHFLLDPTHAVRMLPDNGGCEVDLRNEFKIVYRRETNDWIPDRRDGDAEQEPEVS